MNGKTTHRKVGSGRRSHIRRMRGEGLEKVEAKEKITR